MPALSAALHSRPPLLVPAVVRFAHACCSGSLTGLRCFVRLRHGGRSSRARWFCASDARWVQPLWTLQPHDSHPADCDLRLLEPPASFPAKGGVGVLAPFPLKADTPPTGVGAAWDGTGPPGLSYTPVPVAYPVGRGRAAQQRRSRERSCAADAQRRRKRAACRLRGTSARLRCVLRSLADGPLRPRSHACRSSGHARAAAAHAARHISARRQ